MFPESDETSSTPPPPNEPVIENLEEQEQAPPGTFHLGGFESVLVLGLEFAIARSLRDRDVHFHFPLCPSY